jgi:uncharacterized protein (TIGR01777 family)
MRALLTGGTGFIGRSLAHALRERGDEVVVVSRSGEAGSVAWGDIASEVARADAIVHLAGEPVAGGRWTPARLEKIRASRVDTTATLARAIARAERAPRVFVSGSAIGIYGMRLDNDVLDEQSAPGHDELARIVVAWEGAAATPVPGASASAFPRVVHPRFGMVLGLGGGPLESMATPFKAFVGGSLGTGKQWVSWIHLRDAVRALLFMIDGDALAGPVNVVGPDPAIMDDFAAALGRALHRPSALRVPAFALRAALGKGFAEVVLTGQRVAPRKLVEAGFAFDFPRLDAALADIYRSSTFLWR